MFFLCPLSQKQTFRKFLLETSHLLFQQLAAAAILDLPLHLLLLASGLLGGLFLPDSLAFRFTLPAQLLLLGGFLRPNTLLLLFFSLSLLLHQTAALCRLLLHKLLLGQLLNEYLADLHVRQVIVLGQLLNNLMDKLGLQCPFLSSRCSGDLAIFRIFQISLQNQIIKKNIVIDIPLENLVDLRTLLYNFDGISHLVILAQKLHEFHNFLIVGVSFENIGFRDRSLYSAGFAQLSGKLCAHEHPQNSV